MLIFRLFVRQLCKFILETPKTPLEKFRFNFVVLSGCMQPGMSDNYGQVNTIRKGQCGQNYFVLPIYQQIKAPGNLLCKVLALTRLSALLRDYTSEYGY